MKARKKNKRNFGSPKPSRRWSEQELKTLREMYRKDERHIIIAKKLKRTLWSVEAMASILKIADKSRSAKIRAARLKLSKRKSKGRKLVAKKSATYKSKVARSYPKKVAPAPRTDIATLLPTGEVASA